MESTKFIYWQDQGQWLGYLQDYPEYWTQGNRSKTCKPTFAIRAMNYQLVFQTVSGSEVFA